MSESPAVVAAIEAELRLLDPAVRSSAELIGKLLHPEFTEFGSSGRRWDRESIIAALTAHDAPTARPVTASEMRGVELAPHLVLLTFDTEHKEIWAHRSSLWTLTGGRWLLYFHQGTVFTPERP
ncbi:nuclear transport factor 2 family protein [Streptomyces niveus]|uniref:nuclear transport factor 2 family protein n=1 Tax=Streptomyces niveus TaxID=193462 RepID=UPI0036AC0462